MTATPTPRPTPTPVNLGGYGNLITTPTPYSITPGAPIIDTSHEAVLLANSAINGYRWVNFGATPTNPGVVDFLFFLAMLGAILAFMFKAVKKVKGSDR